MFRQAGTADNPGQPDTFHIGQQVGRQQQNIVLRACTQWFGDSENLWRCRVAVTRSSAVYRLIPLGNRVTGWPVAANSQPVRNSANPNDPKHGIAGYGTSGLSGPWFTRSGGVTLAARSGPLAGVGNLSFGISCRADNEEESGGPGRSPASGERSGLSGRLRRGIPGDSQG